MVEIAQLILSSQFPDELPCQHVTVDHLHMFRNGLNFKPTSLNFCPGICPQRRSKKGATETSRHGIQRKKGMG